MLTVTQIAKKLDISRCTVWQHIKKGMLKADLLGSTYFISDDAYKLYLQTIEANSAPNYSVCHCKKHGYLTKEDSYKRHNSFICKVCTRALSKKYRDKAKDKSNKC